MLLAEYARLVEPTDQMPVDLSPVLFGLFGEVGGVMAASKKMHREKEVFVGFRQAAVDEFGDVLWYLTAIARRLSLTIDSIFSAAAGREVREFAMIASSSPDWPLAVASRVNPAPSLDPTLLKLGRCASSLLVLDKQTDVAKEMLSSFANCFIEALQASQLTFAEVAAYNAEKTRGRFLDADPTTLPTFDVDFEDEERIPNQFEITISERRSGKTYLQWNGVFLGDPLTDNIADPDGYRFHDVFHFAHAAVLHWSPVFRALIKHKRKSVPQIDETQDGGRAMVIEEGLTAWIFSQAKSTGFFVNRHGVSFDLLKSIQKFVAGYEIDQVPLKQWESAILQGYRAFMQVREGNGGVLVGNRDSRTLTFRPLPS
jgi:hypothetical protein